MSRAAPPALFDGDEVLCADDWVFLAEGAFHAVLAYRRARPHAKFSGRVLRIAKHTGALAQHASASLSELVAAFVDDQSLVPRGTACLVPTALLVHALAAAKSAGARTPKRIADCAAGSMAIAAADPLSTRAASLLFDLTAAASSAELGLPDDDDDGAVDLSTSVCIELKVGTECATRIAGSKALISQNSISVAFVCAAQVWRPAHLAIPCFATLGRQGTTHNGQVGILPLCHASAHQAFGTSACRRVQLLPVGSLQC
jgi:hypothetical protein